MSLCIHDNTILIINLHDGNFLMILMSLLIATSDSVSGDVDINLTFNILLPALLAGWNYFVRKEKNTRGGRISMKKKVNLLWGLWVRTKYMHLEVTNDLLGHRLVESILSQACSFYEKSLLWKILWPAGRRGFCSHPVGLIP